MCSNTITPQEANKILSERKDIVVLDVRTEDEYMDGHIKGSIVIPLEFLEMDIEDEVPDKNSIIFIYCTTGRKSEIGCDQLEDLGYENVYDLGGIMDWPYELES